MKVLPETSKLCPFKISKSNGVWRSPEEYAFGLLTEKIDIYSLANVFYSMLSGEYPYEGPSKASWPRVRELASLCTRNLPLA
jgi:serine/threonine protein kinase